MQVIGVPTVYGEELWHMSFSRRAKAPPRDIKDYVRKHMAKHKVPRYVAFVDSFPMNAAGKILKYKMREDAIKLLNLQKDNSVVTA